RDVQGVGPRRGIGVRARHAERAAAARYRARAAGAIAPVDARAEVARHIVREAGVAEGGHYTAERLARRRADASAVWCQHITFVHCHRARGRDAGPIGAAPDAHAQRFAALVSVGVRSAHAEAAVRTRYRARAGGAIAPVD